MLVWQPPAQPNGTITGYDVNLNGQVHQNLTPDANYYEVPRGQQAGTLSLQVSGFIQEVWYVTADVELLWVNAKC